MIKKIKYLFLTFIFALCVISFMNVKSVDALSTKLIPGREIDIANLNGNLKNINIRITIETDIILDGTNNALLIGLKSSDGTLLTDARFVLSSTNEGLMDKNHVALVFQKTPQTIGKCTASNSKYLYIIETKNFNIVNDTKNISKFVVVGQKGNEIDANITIEEVKYSVKFANSEAVMYSYNELIVAPTNIYSYDYNGHKLLTSWVGNDSTNFVNGNTYATKDITYTGNGETQNHNWKSVDGVDATSSEPGIIAHEECLCGAKRLNGNLIQEQDVIIPPTGHVCEFKAIFDWTNATKPLDKPQVCFICDGCHKEVAIEESEIAISEKPNSKTNSTCIVKGKITYIAACTYEGVTATSEKEYELETIDHSLVKHELKNPTCTNDGNIEYYHCSSCNKDFNDKGTEITNIKIKATGHELIKHEQIDSTCTNEGNIEYYSCSKCEKNFIDAYGTIEVEDIVVPKQHTLIKYIKKDATCTKDGNIEYYHCTSCDKNFNEENKQIINITIKATGHKFDENGKCSICSTLKEGNASKDGCMSSLSISIIPFIFISILFFKKRKKNL